MTNISNVPNMPNVPAVPAVAGVDNQVSHFDMLRLQLCGNLTAVATAMRDAANAADHFSQLIRDHPFHPGHSSFLPPNGQFLQVPPAPTPLPAAHTGGKRKNLEDVEDGRKRRKTKPKDPNAPKRPASSYLLFQNEVRQELKQQNPTLPNNELLHLISKAWNDMPKEKKDAYEERQKMAKDQYLLEKAAYEARNQAVVPEVASPVALSPDVGVEPAAVSPIAPAQTSAASSDEGESSAESSAASGSDDSDSDTPPVKKKHAPATIKTEKVKKHKKNKA